MSITISSVLSMAASLWMRPNISCDQAHKAAATSIFPINLDPEGTRIHYWSFFFLAFPTIFVFVDVVWNLPDITQLQETSRFIQVVRSLSNPLGVASCISLAYFLIPVSRGAPMKAFGGLSPIYLLVFHRWAGWFAGVYGLLHSLLHLVAVILNQEAGTSVWAAWKVAFLPPRHCWIPAFNSVKQDDRTCKRPWLFLTGWISAVALAALCLTSFQIVRRKWYSLFYKVHVFVGPTMMMFAILHWPTILVYFAPSIIFYLAATIPTLMHQFNSWVNGGIRVLHAKQIPDSGGCVEIAVEVDPSTSDVSTFPVSPAYSRLCVPSISGIWHPFSVVVFHRRDKRTNPALPDEESTDTMADTSAPDKNPVVCILFRPNGFFTKTLANRVLSLSMPLLLVDGLYAGAFNLPHIFERHSHVVMVAGGVGIVPFIDAIRTFIGYNRSLCDNDSSHLRNLTLVWLCRDEGLMVHVLNTYLRFLWDSKGLTGEFTINSKILIHCHLTHSSDSTQPNPELCPPLSPVTSEDDVSVPNDESTQICDKRGKGIEFLSRDFLSLLSFNVIVWMTTAFVAWQYLFVMPTGTKMSRSRSVWVSIFVSVAVGVLTTKTRHYFKRQRSSDAYYTQLVCEEDQDAFSTLDVNQAHLLEESFMHLPFSDSQNNGLKKFAGLSNSIESINIAIRSFQGRPDMEKELRGVLQNDENSSTGIMICGPRPMRDAVRKVSNVMNEESRNGRLMVYEEISEM
ncbi:ferric reductase NAD binding domain containing protein [Nitzschia inconspicua]|uniref:Ferric reductase NAD binding domain containing protein n=1 Tax=Nitzschia inconspicua TaxID=303405 RepID=A0A9K3M2P8_9STRA|nr:ferric reductase NAD binding domain containing protein [Nitzschia inconspicua]